MDYDLYYLPGDDYMVPPPTSALWDRLPTSAARYVCRREAARFYARDVEETRAKDSQVEPDRHCVHRRLGITLLLESHEIRVGRHLLKANPSDIAHLKARYMEGIASENKEPRHEQDLKMYSRIAHVLSLYSIFESPLADAGQKRSNLQLGLDPVLRRKFCYEIFASPMNAAVPNGFFLSKFPHVEQHFGSLGKFSPLFLNCRMLILIL